MSSEAITRYSLLLSALCFLLGALMTVLDVFLRAIWNANLPGVIEATALSIGLGALLSMPACYLKDANVTARLFSELKPKLFKRPFLIVGSSFSLVFAISLFYIMTTYVIESWGTPESTPDLGFPKDLLLLLISVSFFIAILAASKRLTKALKGVD